MSSRCGTSTGARQHVARGEVLCEACKRWRRRYEKSRRAGAVYSVPASEVWAHVEALRDAGLGIKQIADRAGLAEISVSRIRHQERCLARTARKILAVEPPTLADLPAGALVSARGSRRRLLALQWQRWGPQHLAPLTTVSEDALWRIRSGESTRVRAGTAREIARLFDQIGTDLGPGIAGRGIPAAAWDDIDDPRERAKGVA